MTRLRLGLVLLAGLILSNGLILAAATPKERKPTAAERRTAEKAAKEAEKKAKADRKAAEKAARAEKAAKARTAATARPPLRRTPTVSARPAAASRAGQRSNGLGRVGATAKGAAAKTAGFTLTTEVMTNQWGDYEPPPSLRRPYIAMNATKQIVEPGERITIPVFVTDYDNSLLRLDDDSFRFSVTVTIRKRGDFAVKETVLKPENLQNVRAGDYETELPAFAEGEWLIGVRCVDNLGRQSHSVWHEIWCREPGRYADEIAKATKTVTLAEIEAKGGAAEREGFYRLVAVPVDVSGLSNEQRKTYIPQAVRDYEADDKTPPPEGGYTIYTAADETGVPQYWARTVCRIKYAPTWDPEAVAARALKTTEAIQLILEEAASNGMRKVILPKAVFRVSHEKSISIPDRLTLDLNGATLKLNGFTGHSGSMVSFKHTFDSHLVNGTIEGDYFEHDYENSKNNSEWVMGANISGECRYTTIENMTIRNITGYGAGNGFSGNHGVFSVEGSGAGWKPGALDLATGEVVPGEPSQFTSRFYGIDKFAEKGYITFSRFLGYQGRAARAWPYSLAFYGAGEGTNKVFLAGGVEFQYRHVPVPEGAKFARVTIEAADLKGAEGGGLHGALFRMPINCGYISNRFERCRCVGLAPSAMLNMRIEGNVFTYSGESAARCAFDAEDGWNMMQDVLIKGNTFTRNPCNELLLCAGHDFLIEDNDCSVHLYDRVQSTLVRNNRFKSAFFGSGMHDRTMHARYTNNTYSVGLTFGDGANPKACKGWTTVMRGLTFGDVTAGATPVKYRGSCGGQLRDCRLANMDVQFGNFARCRLENVRFGIGGWKGWFTDCVFTNCLFQHFLEKETRFTRCNLMNTTLAFAHGADISFDGCRFFESGLSAFGFEPPVVNAVRFTDCEVENNRRALVQMPLQLIDTLSFDGCVFAGTNSVVKIDGFKTSTNDVTTARILLSQSKQTTENAMPLVFAPFGGATTRKLEVEVTKTKLMPGVEVMDKKHLKPDNPAHTRDWTVKVKTK